MALVLKDRVKETSTTTGTGTFTLAGAVTGFQSFSVIGNGNTVYYCIVRLGSSEWEVGIGTYTSSGTLLSRDTILESSNSGSAVNFGAGTKEVFCTYPAEKAVTTDISGTTPPQVTIYTSGSGTYTVPSGCKYLIIEMVGGGGGGAGSGGSAGAGNGGVGGNGGNSTFNSSNLIAGGGYGASSGNLVGDGGTVGSLAGVSNGMGTAGTMGSANGNYNNTLGAYSAGGRGAPTPLNGYGKGGIGGGTGANTTVPGGGGGSAAWIWAVMNTPASSYSYAVGAAGTAGAAGTNGGVGGAGGGGCIVIQAYF